MGASVTGPIVPPRNKTRILFPFSDGSIHMSRMSAPILQHPSTPATYHSNVFSLGWAIPFYLTIINPKESTSLGCSSRCSARQGAYCRKSRGKSSAVKPCRFKRWRVRAISNMRLRSLANVTPVTLSDIGHLLQRRMFKLTSDLLSQ